MKKPLTSATRARPSKLLVGGNPQIAKADGNVRVYMDPMPASGRPPAPAPSHECRQCLRGRRYRRCGGLRGGTDRVRSGRGGSWVRPRRFEAQPPGDATPPADHLSTPTNLPRATPIGSRDATASGSRHSAHTLPPVRLSDLAHKLGPGHVDGSINGARVRPRVVLQDLDHQARVAGGDYARVQHAQETDLALGLTERAARISPRDTQPTTGCRRLVPEVPAHRPGTHSGGRTNPYRNSRRNGRVQIPACGCQHTYISRDVLEPIDTFERALRNHSQERHFWRQVSARFLFFQRYTLYARYLTSDAHEPFGWL